MTARQIAEKYHRMHPDFRGDISPRDIEDMLTKAIQEYTREAIAEHLERAARECPDLDLVQENAISNLEIILK